VHTLTKATEVHLPHLTRAGARVPPKATGFMRRFPRRLHHELPLWVDPSGAVFHIRIRTAANNPVPLAEDKLAPKLLDSVIECARRAIWWPNLFLLMPDHIHALLSLNPIRRMSRVIGDWKKWTHQNYGVIWQDNFFDHRIRRDESLEEKGTYIRRNPVVKGLCNQPEDWPWVLDGELVRKKLS
jgi:putative transposase